MVAFTPSNPTRMQLLYQVKTKHLILIGIIICHLVSYSSTEADFAGMYVSPKLKNNADTLLLKNDGTYLRKLHRKKDGKLIFFQTGKWDYNDPYVHVDDFLIDLDREYLSDYDFNSVLMGCSFIPEAFLDGTTYINYGPYDDEKFIYVKIK